MSIEKLEFSYATKEQIPYTLASTHVIQNIKDPVALAVWIYLSSHSSVWSVNKHQLRKHFNVGEKKLRSVFSYLNKSNLIQYVRERNQDGTLGSVGIHVLCGDKFECAYRQENEQVTTQAKTALVDHRGKNHTGGKEGTNKENKNIINTNLNNEDINYISPPFRKRKKSDLPDSFIPKDSHYRLGEELNIDVDDQLINFKEYHLKHGNQFANWDMALNTWIRNAKRFKNDTFMKKTYRPGEALSIACGGGAAQQGRTFDAF